MHKFDYAWIWENWTFGVIVPHGGMVVWVLCIGPLMVSFWPLARKVVDVEPF